MLELASDLRLFDEAPDQVGPMVMLLEQDLDGQVAAEIGIAPLEHDPHRAAGDLAQQLHPRRAVRRHGPFGRRWPDRRGLGATPDVAQQDAWQGAGRAVEGLEHAASGVRPVRAGWTGVGPGLRLGEGLVDERGVSRETVQVVARRRRLAAAPAVGNLDRQRVSEQFIPVIGAGRWRASFPGESGSRRPTRPRTTR